VTYTIRRAVAGDAALIARQRRCMFEDMGETDASKLAVMAAESLPWLSRKLSANEYLGWFAVAPDDSLAAGAGLWIIEWPPTMMDLSGRRGMILNVYVHREHRRRGLARQLTQTALDWCRENRITVVTLHASRDGRPVYEQLGFQPTNEMRLLL